MKNYYLKKFTMEQILNIKTPDKFLIRGILNTPKNKTSKLIIIIHGLTGHPNEHHLYNSSKTFVQEGYATFRPALYYGEKGCRNLTNCTVKIHSQDINTVVNYFKKKYKKIFIVGHSLGGPSIVLSNLKNYTAITLWDPSTNTKILNEEARFDKKRNAYILDWGQEIILGNDMYNETIKFNDYTEYVKESKVPLKIIVAGKGIMVDSARDYFLKTKGPKAYYIVQNASHCFDEEGTEEELLAQTIDWFNEY